MLVEKFTSLYLVSLDNAILSKCNEGGSCFMNDNERNELISLRLENSQSAMQESKLLIDNGYWNAAVNRMYYGCYYAVSALLISKGIQAQTHASTSIYFDEEITTNLYPQAIEFIENIKKLVSL